MAPSRDILRAGALCAAVAAAASALQRGRGLGLGLTAFTLAQPPLRSAAPPAAARVASAWPQLAARGAGASPHASGFAGVAGGSALALCAAFTAVVGAVVRASRVACRVSKEAKAHKARVRARELDKGHTFTNDNGGYRINGGPGRPGSPHAWTENVRWAHRFKRRIHLRKKLEGTPARPRLAVFRSKEHIHVNVVDDTVGTGITLLTITTRQAGTKEEIRVAQGAEKNNQYGNTVEAAEIVGRAVAKMCLEKNITKVVFDRGGFPYEGRVMALAEAARSAGLQF